MNVSRYVWTPLLVLYLACEGASSEPKAQSLATRSTLPVDAGQGASTTAIDSASDAANGEALQMPALEPEFQRLIGPPVEVPPEASNDWMQWVGGPTDQDYDVSQMKGAQSTVGHHAILYTTTEANPIGFTRLWSESDQLTTQTVGGLGAEGAIPVPAGVVLRVRKGTYLVFDVHYLNSTDAMQIGQTYMDIELMPSNPANVLASRVANSTLMIELPPHQQVTQDLNCPLNRALQLLRFTNHMHQYGVSAFTEFIDPSGSHQMIKVDDVWSSDWSLSPNYTFYPLDAPLMVPAGSTLHTRCVWNNTTDKSIEFPDEMCAFSGLIIDDSDITCLDGQTL